MVIVWHYFYSEIHPTPHSILARVATPFSLCWSGVDLFFVLSGFLIGGILVDSRQADNYFRVFYVRRVCRIAPVYFLLLASFGVAYAVADPHGRFAWLLEDPLPALSYVTFTQNIVMGLRGTFGPTWLAPTWSLAVEEQFYSLLPIVVWALPPKALRVLLIVAICSAPLLRSMCSELTGQVEMPMRSDSLLLGAMVAIRCEASASSMPSGGDAGSSWPRSSSSSRGPPSCASARTGSVSSCRPGSPRSTARSSSCPSRIPGFAISRILRSPLLRFFGTISYSLYLVHEIVVGLLHGVVYGRAPRIDDAASAGLTIAAFAVSVLLARGTFEWIEKKAVAVGHRYGYRLPAAQGST